MNIKQLKESCNVLAEKIWNKYPKHIKIVRNHQYMNLGYNKGYMHSIEKVNNNIFFSPYWRGGDYKNTWQEVYDFLTKIENGTTKITTK